MQRSLDQKLKPYRKSYKSKPFKAIKGWHEQSCSASNLPNSLQISEPFKVNSLGDFYKILKYPNYTPKHPILPLLSPSHSQPIIHRRLHNKIKSSHTIEANNYLYTPGKKLNLSNHPSLSTISSTNLFDSRATFDYRYSDSLKSIKNNLHSTQNAGEPGCFYIENESYRSFQPLSEDVKKGELEENEKNCNKFKQIPKGKGNQTIKLNRIGNSKTYRKVKESSDFVQKFKNFEAKANTKHKSYDLCSDEKIVEKDYERLAHRERVENFEVKNWSVCGSSEKAESNEGKKPEREYGIKDRLYDQAYIMDDSKIISNDHINGSIKDQNFKHESKTAVQDVNTTESLTNFKGYEQNLTVPKTLEMRTEHKNCNLSPIEEELFRQEFDSEASFITTNDQKRKTLKAKRVDRRQKSVAVLTKRQKLKKKSNPVLKDLKGTEEISDLVKRQNTFTKKIGFTHRSLSKKITNIEEIESPNKEVASELSSPTKDYPQPFLKDTTEVKIRRYNSEINLSRKNTENDHNRKNTDLSLSRKNTSLDIPSKDNESELEVKKPLKIFIIPPEGKGSRKKYRRTSTSKSYNHLAAKRSIKRMNSMLEAESFMSMSPSSEIAYELEEKSSVDKFISNYALSILGKLQLLLVNLEEDASNLVKEIQTLEDLQRKKLLRPGNVSPNKSYIKKKLQVELSLILKPVNNKMPSMSTSSAIKAVIKNVKNSIFGDGLKKEFLHYIKSNRKPSKFKLFKKEMSKLIKNRFPQNKSATDMLYLQSSSSSSSDDEAPEPESESSSDKTPFEHYSKKLTRILIAKSQLTLSIPGSPLNTESSANISLDDASVKELNEDFSENDTEIKNELVKMNWCSVKNLKSFLFSSTVNYRNISSESIESVKDAYKNSVEDGVDIPNLEAFIMKNRFFVDGDYWKKIKNQPFLNEEFVLKTTEANEIDPEERKDLHDNQIKKYLRRLRNEKVKVNKKIK